MNILISDPGNDYKKPMLTGTTIMAVVYDKGVILGADSRTTMGSYVGDRCADKIDYVHDKICALRAGRASDTQTLCRYVRYGINMHAVELNELPQVKTAARLFQNYVYEYKDQLNAALIVAGWDNQNGGQVFSIQPGGAVFQDDYALQGSGSGYIFAYVDANYRKNMSFQEARQLVINAISLASTRDGSSGGVVRLMNITADKNEREFIDAKDKPYQ